MENIDWDFFSGVGRAAGEIPGPRCHHRVFPGRTGQDGAALLPRRCQGGTQHPETLQASSAALPALLACGQQRLRLCSEAPGAQLHHGIVPGYDSAQSMFQCCREQSGCTSTHLLSRVCLGHPSNVRYLIMWGIFHNENATWITSIFMKVLHGKKASSWKAPTWYGVLCNPTMCHGR